MAYPLVLVTAVTPALALQMSEGLGRYGYETLVALDEADALALVHAERRLGVLIVDVDGGGLNVSREARAARPGLGVIYTARNPQHIPMTARVKDAPIVRTPCTAHQLVALIGGLGKRVLEEPLAA